MIKPVVAGSLHVQDTDVDARLELGGGDCGSWLKQARWNRQFIETDRDAEALEVSRTESMLTHHYMMSMLVQKATRSA